MELNKIKDTMILDDNNKKLEIHVNVNSNLDFSMNFKSDDKFGKDAYYFEINDKNPSIYYAISKLYENLLNEYNNHRLFYKNRYKEFQLYNEKLEMFKFHSDNKKLDPNGFVRIFKQLGRYYIFFNMGENKSLKLSKNQSRYPNFVKYFNEFYSNLEKEYIRQNKFNVKTYKYGDKKNG